MTCHLNPSKGNGPIGHQQLVLNVGGNEKMKGFIFSERGQPNTMPPHKLTQIFIETPYRNNKLLDDILKLNDQSLRLCVAINLTGNDQSIHMGTIKEWHKKKMPELDKKLCVYLIN